MTWYAALVASRALQIGHRIAEARQAAKLTQAQLAERLDVATETVGRIERGHHMPSLERLEDVARAVGTDLAALLRTDRPSRQERAIVRVVAMLRRRDAEDAELVADLVERIFKRWP